MPGPHAHEVASGPAHDPRRHPNPDVPLLGVVRPVEPTEPQVYQQLGQRDDLDTHLEAVVAQLEDRLDRVLMPPNPVPAPDGPPAAEPVLCPVAAQLLAQNIRQAHTIGRLTRLLERIAV